MRVLILGVSGMLGHKLLDSFSDVSTVEVFGTVRRSERECELFPIFKKAQIFYDVDAFDFNSLAELLTKIRPDVVVNCIGVVKQILSETSYLDCLYLNSSLPKQLAFLSSQLGFRLFHISTDCVFSGESGSYKEDDIPDARDLYGLSKFIGEPAGEKILTLRTSVIGFELFTRHSLLEWFLSKR